MIGRWERGIALVGALHLFDLRVIKVILQCHVSCRHHLRFPILLEHHGHIVGSDDGENNLALINFYDRNGSANSV